LALALVACWEACCSTGRAAKASSSLLLLPWLLAAWLQPAWA
jgi:hypothetical protein